MVMSGEGAVESDAVAPGMNTGFTIGAGLQQPLGANTLRYEVVYDKADTNTKSPEDYEPTFESISLKVSLIFN